MKSSNLVPLSVLVAVAAGLIVVDLLAEVDWPWFAVAIALAAAFAHIVRPGRSACVRGRR